MWRKQRSGVALAASAWMSCMGCMQNPSGTGSAGGSTNVGSATEVTLIVRPVENSVPLADALVSVRRCAEEQAFCGGRTGAAGEFECPDPVLVGEDLCIYVNCCSGSFIGFGTSDHVQVLDQGGGRMVVSVDLFD